MSVKIQIADYRNPRDGEAIRELMDIYAKDPMGGGKPLDADVMERLIPTLARFPGAFSVFACIDDTPVGLINCIETLSTFKASPIVNVHDVVVHPKFRGWGIASLMLEQVEKVARERGCCKLTLELLEGNGTAKKLYERFGFSGYELDPRLGKAMLWQKFLDNDE